MIDKQCGTCKWWKKWVNDPDGTDLGDCDFHLPSLPESLMHGKICMGSTEGQSCPVWEERKE